MTAEARSGISGTGSQTAHLQRLNKPDSPNSAQEDITTLLRRWGRGEAAVLSQLIPLVYEDLRRLADRSLRRERLDHTLQPTALVHEAYLRLAHSAPPELEDRRHFLCMAARLMRQILVDHARRVKADRRGGQAPRVALERAFEEAALLLPPVDLLALNDALESLTKLDPRKARVIELRFFGGFEVKEVAELLRVSVPTVVTDTRVARAWLLSRIDGRPSNDHRLD